MGGRVVAHRRLPDLGTSELRTELVESRRLLIDSLGACDDFAYPFGAVSRASVDAVRRGGYATACPTRAGINRPGDSPWELRRILVSRRTTLSRFKRQLRYLW